MDLLLVEDEDLIRSMIREIILASVKGTNITEATTYERARELIATEHFDSAIFDHLIPGGSGLDLVQEYSEKRPGKRSLMLTAFGGDEEFKKDALSRGAHLVLKKPILPKDLIKAIYGQSPLI